MKIFVTGTRGIPDIPGGVERHCQELYPRIAAAGHDVIVATRASYVTQKKSCWQGVHLCHLYAPKKKSIEAIVHTLFAVLKARAMNADILHVHAVGPGLLVPLARVLGLRVVVTNHGPDYNRAKWGKVARAMLRSGEYLGGKFANEVIVISTGIADILRERFGRTTHLIYNGVSLPEKSKKTDFLEQLGIRPGKYILAVARFVPEKGLHDLIRAFKGLSFDSQLVLAGDADHESDYSAALKKQAGQDKRIILTGYIGGEKLNQVFSHAGLFVLPSYHEGLPIALLEAMSYDLPLLVSDIAANREVGLDKKRYFPCGHVEALQSALQKPELWSMELAERQRYQSLLQEKYNWKAIAAQTIKVYETAFGRKSA